MSVSDQIAIKHKLNYSTVKSFIRKFRIKKRCHPGARRTLTVRTQALSGTVAPSYVEVLSSLGWSCSSYKRRAVEIPAWLARTSIIVFGTVGGMCY
jgi:hypothetical protein